jgi:hypothetical protein
MMSDVGFGDLEGKGRQEKEGGKIKMEEEMELFRLIGASRYKHWLAMAGTVMADTYVS